MAKGQKRGNREAKKPKQEKQAKVADSPFAMAISPMGKAPPRKERPGA